MERIPAQEKMLEATRRGERNASSPEGALHRAPPGRKDVASGASIPQTDRSLAGMASGENGPVWEYLVEYVGAKPAAAPMYLTAILNQRGGAGWELAALVPNEQTFPASSMMFTAVWKRST